VIDLLVKYELDLPFLILLAPPEGPKAAPRRKTADLTPAWPKVHRTSNG
jgi:hypothetical protein